VRLRDLRGLGFCKTFAASALIPPPQGEGGARSAPGGGQRSDETQSPPDSRSASPPREPPSPKTGRDSVCVARSCANIGFNFQTAGVAFSQRCAAPVLCKARGGPSFLPLTNVRERSTGRRGNGFSRLAAGLRGPPREGVHASCDASASRRSTGGICRWSLSAGTHHQPRAAFLEPAFAPANAASSSQSAHSGARAESRSRPSARLRASPAGAAPRSVI